MTVVHNAKTKPTYPPTSLEFAGIRLSTRAEGSATVVAASGEIDASNIDRLTDYVRSVLRANCPLVIDLSELSFFGAQGIPALFMVSEECGRAGVGWAVVTSHPVQRLLRIGDKDRRLPTVSSVPDALKRLATPTPARRLLQLVTKSG
jgi:anti-anti-sigma factor